MVDVVPLCSVNPCMLTWPSQVSGNAPVYLGQWGSSPLSHLNSSQLSSQISPDGAIDGNLTRLFRNISRQSSPDHGIANDYLLSAIDNDTTYNENFFIHSVTLDIQNLSVTKCSSQGMCNPFIIYGHSVVLMHNCILYCLFLITCIIK